MKKFITKIVLLAVCITTISMAFPRLKNRYFPYIFIQEGVKLNPKEKLIGIYYPEKQEFHDKPDFQHIQIDLKDGNWKTDLRKLKSLSANNIVLTINQWQRGVLNKMNQPESDEVLKPFLSEIGSLPFQQIYLRWLPEMELSDGTNPWGNWGRFYSNLLEKMDKILKKQNSRLKILWSPSGATGLMEYFPSFSYDAAGVNLDYSLLSLNKMRFNDKPLFLFSEDESLVIEDIKKRLLKVDYSVAKDLIDPDTINWAQNLQFGVYEYEIENSTKNNIDIEHIFINFQAIDNGELKSKLNGIKRRSNIPFITVEPGNSSSSEDKQVMLDLLKGEYDYKINLLYQQLEDFDSIVYLRFAHEMEIPIRRYNWQSMLPQNYIKAYQYFLLPSLKMPNIKKVWGPAGDKASMEYWPGKDYVDYVSFSIYGLPDKNITNFEKQESFGKIYDRKSRRLRYLPKPFIIAEFGVKGNDDYKRNWLNEAAEIIRNDNRIKAAIYFNSQDVPEAWGDITPPDWHISPAILDNFVTKLKKERHAE